MCRIESVKTELEKAYLLYNSKVKKPLPELDTSSEKKLTKLLDTVLNRESQANHTNDKSYPQKRCFSLRGKIADLLLLMDNFDIKKKKENNGSPKTLSEDAA